MSKISHGQKGYVGSSMSVRATWAYEAGEKSLSKFTAADKDELNRIIGIYAPESGLEVKTVKQLRVILKKWGETSYHHTGSYANTTSFYHLCGLFDIANPDEWENEVTSENQAGFQIRMKAAVRMIQNGEL